MGGAVAIAALAVSDDGKWVAAAGHDLNQKHTLVLMWRTNHLRAHGQVLAPRSRHFHITRDIDFGMTSSESVVQQDYLQNLSKCIPNLRLPASKDRH